MAEKCSAIGGKALLTDRHYKFFTVTRLLQMLMYLDLFLEDKFLEKELLAQKLHILWTPERWFWYTYSQGSSGDADIGNRYADMAGGRRGRTNRERTNEESGMETHTPYGKQPASGDLLWHGELSPVLWDNLQGWDGDGREVQEQGTYVHLWLMLVDIWQKPAQYCKAIIFQYNFFKDNKQFKNTHLKILSIFYKFC